MNSPCFYIAVDGATQMMERAINTNQNAIKSWDQRWLTIFDSALFDIIIYMSTFAGVAAICVWMVNELKDFDGGDYLFKRSFYVNLMWALFVMALLVPGGVRIKGMAQGLHTFGQNFNQQALAYQFDDIAIEDAIRATVGRGTLQADISAQMSQCEGLIGERQFACLGNARQQIMQMIDTYEEDWVIDLPGGFRQLEESLTTLLYGTDGPDILNGEGRIGNRATDGNLDGFQNADDNRIAERLPAGGNFPGGNILAGQIGAMNGFFMGALASTVQSTIQAILFDFQWAFVNLLELAMLLTAMVLPFALALSFIPGTGRPVVAWLLAYTSMIMVQFYYNIMTGIMAVVVLKSNAIDINGFLIVLAVFGPVLAIKLAQGGGIAVFDALTSGTIGLALAAAGISSRSLGNSKK